MEKYFCAVCGIEFVLADDYGGCSVCGWYSCTLQEKDPDYLSGANNVTLNEARREWKEKQGEIPLE